MGLNNIKNLTKTPYRTQGYMIFEIRNPKGTLEEE